MNRLTLGFLIGLAAVNCAARENSVVRLAPSQFSELPKNLVAELERRQCTIPQVPMEHSRHNVIQGEFAKPGQRDWAVLCSNGRDSSILIFWNSSEKNPTQIEERPDQNSFQSWTDGKMVYSRLISPVCRETILKHYAAYGGEQPPPIDHLGIDDAFYGKASEALYLFQGKWLRLSGAD